MERIPIPFLDVKQQLSLVSLVKLIIEKKEVGETTDHIEDKLNILILDFFCLTQDEKQEISI